MAKNLDLGMRCIKYMLFISSAMFVMIGFLLISIGSTIISIYSDFEIFLETHHFRPALILVGVGGITFLGAIFGCLGAIRESTLLVNLYGLFLLLTFSLELCAAFAADAFRTNMLTIIEDAMYGAMSEYGENTLATQSWDFTQERLMCCGVRVVQDWTSQKINGTEVTIESKTFGIPKSCCSYPNCDTFYERGCLERITSIISECSEMLETGAICVALVQVLGFIFARMLANAIRRVKTNREMTRQLKRQEIYEQIICGSEYKRTPVLYTPTSSEV